MSHRISNNLKGALGEIFVKNEFEDFNLIDIRNGFSKIPGIPKIPHLNIHDIDFNNKLEEWMIKREKATIEKYGTTTFPDYYIENTNFFLEIKTGKSAKLEKNQVIEFPKILEKGFRIFIVKPKILIEKRKFEVVNFYCSEFLGNNSRRKLSIDDIKKIIKK